MGVSIYLSGIAAAGLAVSGSAQDGRVQSADAALPPAATVLPAGVELTPAQLFGLADDARNAGDLDLAERAYRALSAHPDIDIRLEARFRLATMLAEAMARPRDAAVELRRILDERPDSPRVRLELARINAQLGRFAAAEREFRAVQASGQLPPDVERAVRFYSSALAAVKPLGGSIEIALAPDSNINRATRSDTLGTVLGNFALSDDARAKSGLGLALRAQGYARLPLNDNTRLLARVSGNGDFYRVQQFDDYALAVQAGPEFLFGADRLTLSAGPSWRWYGQQPFSHGWGGSVVYQHPTGKRSQIRAEGGAFLLDNRRNALQDATLYSGSVGIDRAFSARFGGGLQLRASRTAARDPGWSDWTGGTSLYAFREWGGTTLVLDGSFSRLTADKRLVLYPEKRVDNRFSLGLGATFRAIQWKGLAPYLRVRADRNDSTVGIYDFSRRAAEFGVTSAF